jgi:hypothetical protein
VSTHPVFVAPPDTNVRIWRYMDFTKYVAMLETTALYFARADRFEDPFEGASTKANRAARPTWYSGEDWKDGVGENVQKFLPKFYEASRKWTYINCWHLNEVESAAMWKLYASSNEAIAIQTTFTKLAAAMPEHTHVGLVQYIDYEKDFVPESNTLYRFVRKRESFAHEREVRAIQQDPITEGEQMHYDKENPALGKLIVVDLPKLIERVYVAPTAPTWFGELVEKSTSRFGFAFPVIASSLDEKPVY